MIDQPISDMDRKRLLDLALAAVPLDHGDDQLTRIIAVLSGVDTVLVARRAYPARGSQGVLFMSEDALALLEQGSCPDCHKHGMVPGPKGGVCTNEACPHCGTEFNVGRVGGKVVMAHHNPMTGGINRERLRTVFGIVLPD